MPKLTIAVEHFPVAGRFVIARGARTTATVVTVTLEENGLVGRGECVPYPRYGESVQSVVAELEALRKDLEDGLDRTDLQVRMAAGAARNGADCALWDFDAKRSGTPAHVLAGIDRLRPVATAYTLSLDSPDAMGAAAARAADRPILKVKLGGGDEDPARLAAVRRHAPDTTVIVDANEGWTTDNIAARLAMCADAGVALVEQPLPTEADSVLADLKRPVPVCADESLHSRAELAALRGRYDVINIKLDKAGGLTEALALADAADKAGFAIMIGCMLSTSLAMAPALLLAGKARFVDLDGPLLLAADRPSGIRYDGSIAYPPGRALWG